MGVRRGTNPWRLGKPALLMAACLLAGGLLWQVAWAQPAVAPVAPAGAPGVVAVTGQIAPDSYGIYLLDPQARTIALYEWDMGRGSLRLRAARSYASDTQLEEYNTQPSPREIRKLVAQQRGLDSPP